MSKVIRKSHNASILIYHSVCPAKYRRVVFNAEVDQELKAVCLEIAKRYKTVIVTNIPQLQQRSQNEIILFIKLIDILYDAKICLIISADTRVDDLYLSGKYISEFSRTRSRLLEMQSDKYVQSINHHLIL